MSAAAGGFQWNGAVGSDMKPVRGPNFPTDKMTQLQPHFFHAGIECEGEKLIPISEKVVKGDGNSQKKRDYIFVAIPEAKFKIRVRTSRPTAAGMPWGCRVIFDQGDGDDVDDARKEFEKAKEAAEKGKVGLEQAELEAQLEGRREALRKAKEYSAKDDHYAWFNHGETDLVIDGFYRDSHSSFAMSFGKTPEIQCPAQEPMKKRMKRARRLGWIRIEFSKVKEFRRRQDAEVFDQPTQAGIASSHGLDMEGNDRFYDEKMKLFSVSTKPEQTVVHHGGAISEEAEEAVLEEDVQFSVRLFYASFDNIFKGGRVVEASRFRAVPLDVLSQKYVRNKAVRACVTRLQKSHFDASEPAAAAAAAAALSTHNDLVRVEDIVHYTNLVFSPAAAYVICTGKDALAEFGEKRVQGEPKPSHVGDVSGARGGVQWLNRDAHFTEKEEALLKFFEKNPYDYEIVDVGKDDQGRQCHGVKFAVQEIF